MYRLLRLTKTSLTLIITNAGRRTDFRDKNRELFSGELFSGAALLPVNFVAINVCGVDHFPRIRTFVQKRFHGLFSKKKRSKSGVFLRFQKENTFGQ